MGNDALKGRIFEVSLADLQKDEDHAFRKVKLRADEVQGKNVLTNFHGLDFTSDELRSLVRKWQSLIEANVVVKTTDDYLLRLFCIAFTKRRPDVIGRDIEKSTQGIYPLQNVHVRKVKLLRAPKFDLGALLSLHGESSADDSGKPVNKEFKEQVLETV